MADDVDLLQSVVEGVPREVEPSELKPDCERVREVGALSRRVVVVSEGVHAEHALAAREQRLTEV